jgi:hypothetical protein
MPSTSPSAGHKREEREPSSTIARFSWPYQTIDDQQVLPPLPPQSWPHHVPSDPCDTHRFARDAPRLLDLCCGRGGDMHKWSNAGVSAVLFLSSLDNQVHHLAFWQVKVVKGIDVSDGEVLEATRRYQELKGKGANHAGRSIILLL